MTSTDPSGLVTERERPVMSRAARVWRSDSLGLPSVLRSVVQVW
jgi:hypothetical protein